MEAETRLRHTSPIPHWYPTESWRTMPCQIPSKASPMTQLLSFVIPCYHSDQTLSAVVDDVLATVESDERYTCEVLLVNDNAPDATWDVIQGLCEAHDQVSGLCMMHNFGQHAALMAGYRASSGNIVISLDDDGQTPPSEAFKLVEQIEQGADLVYCHYEGMGFSSGFRRFGSTVNDHMAHWLLDKPRGLYLSSYFAATRAVVEEVVRYQGPFPYVDGLFLRSAGRIRSVEVSHLEREQGASGYSLRKLLSLWLNGFTAFSVKPLRVATILGSVFALVGFVFALVVLVRKIIFDSAIDAGWSSLMCVLLVVGGLIMVTLGLVGEYVGRIYISQNQSPQYVVRERCGGGARPSSTAKAASGKDDAAR